MTLTDYAAIAELIAASGVIASLLFLAVQVKKGSATDNSSNILATVRALSDWSKDFSSNDELAKVCRKGFKDYGSLSEIESERFHYAMVSIVILVESVVLSNKLGVIGEEELTAGTSWIVNFAANKGFRDWWHSRGRKTFTKTFVEYVENLEALETDQVTQIWS